MAFPTFGTGLLPSFQLWAESGTNTHGVELCDDTTVETETRSAGHWDPMELDASSMIAAPRRGKSNGTAGQATVLRSISDTTTFPDFAVFYHYYTVAFPQSHIGTRELWTRDLLVYTHEHRYLLDAMLALGAADLDVKTQGYCGANALMYRAKAIDGLLNSRFLSSEGRENADCQFAAALLLQVQASFVPDGVRDFLLSAQSSAASESALGEHSIFAPWRAQSRLTSMPMLAHAGRRWTAKASRLVETASNAIASIQDICENEIHTKYTHLLMIAIDNFVVNPSRTYQALVELNDMYLHVTTETWAILFTFADEVAWLIINHWLALHILVQYYDAAGSPDSKTWLNSAVMGRWIEGVNARISVGLRQHTTWTQSMAALAISPPAEDLDPCPETSDEATDCSPQQHRLLVVAG